MIYTQSAPCAPLAALTSRAVSSAVVAGGAILAIRSSAALVLWLAAVLQLGRDRAICACSSLARSGQCHGLGDIRPLRDSAAALWVKLSVRELFMLSPRCAGQLRGIGRSGLWRAIR